MDKYEIRLATEMDSPEIEKLSVQLGYASSVAETSGRLVKLLGTTGHCVFVACSTGGSAVGWVHVYEALRLESGAFSELGGLVVAESHRGQGIGRMLLGAVEDWTLEQGIRKLRVRTRAERKEAHEFYERVGFSNAKEQCVYDKYLGPAA